MASSFVKVFMVLVCINTLLFTAGIRVIGDDNADFVSQFIDVENSTGGKVIPSSTLENTLPQTLQQGGSTLLQFIDSLGAVGDFVSFVINIVFTPLGLFVSMGMPSEIVVIIGIPLMTFLFLGVAYFIRSGA